MNSSGSVASYCLRRWSTCRAMMSRKLSPRRTQSSDLARSMPIEVPRPPLSLMTAVLRIASARDVVGHLDVGQRLHVEGLDRALGDHAGLAVLEEPVVVRERVDRDLVDPGLAHLLARQVEAVGAALACHASIVGCGRGRARTRRQTARGRQDRAARPGAGRPPASPAGRRAPRSRRPISRRRARPGTPYATPPPWRRTSPSAASRAPACCSTRSSPPASGCSCRWCCPTSTSTGPSTPDRDRLAPAVRAGCSSRPGRGSASTRSRRPTWCSCPGSRSRPPATGSGQGGGCYDRALARVPAGTPVAVVLYDDEVGRRRADATPTTYGWGSR